MILINTGGYATTLIILFVSYSANGFVRLPIARHYHHIGKNVQIKKRPSCNKLLLNLSPPTGGESETSFDVTEKEEIVNVLPWKQIPSMVAARTEDAVAPIMEALDDASDGWALSYADLSPATETSAIGQAFLATNLAYAIVGLLIGTNGDPFFGFLVEISSIFSFGYHYAQLQASNDRSIQQDKAVRLALLLDYIVACSTILVGLGYVIMDQTWPPLEALVSWSLGVGFLSLGWVWEYGIPYLITHSFWHLFSAYGAFVVGTVHASNHLSAL